MDDTELDMTGSVYEQYEYLFLYQYFILINIGN